MFTSDGLFGRALGRVTAALVAVLWVVTSLVMPPTAQAADPSQVSIKKSVSPSAAVPGDEVLYTLEVSCSGLTTDCLSPVITDQLPADLELVSVPGSSSERTISVDSAGLLRAEYVIPLSSPPNDPGATGLPAGATRKIAVSMRVPLNAQPGTVTNSATFKGTNTNEATSSVDLTVTVPRVLRVVGTKAWSPISAVAQSADASTILLGTRNASSVSAEVTSLSISDLDTDTFEHFDVTRLGPVTAYPAGADQVEILVCQTTVPCTAPTSVGTFSGSGPFTPAGVNLADVTGVRFVYSNSGGAVLPPSTTNSGVELGLVLRDTFRSTGAVLEPPARIRVTNDASPALVDKVAGPTTGTPVSAVYDINPNTLVAETTKKFGPDDNLNYQESGKAYAGQGSGVFMEITGKDASGFNVASMQIIEPDPSDTAAKAAFATVNATEFKVKPPTGTQSTTVTVECRTSGTQTRTFTGTSETTFTVASICGANDHPASISVKYEGTTVGGAGAIATGSTGTLRLVGRMNGTEVAGPLQNCAVTNLANPVNSSGAGTAQGCATLTVLQSTLKTATTKDFFSDTNGDFAADGTAYAGQASGVAMTIGGQNTSGFAVDQMVIAEPNPSNATSVANFAKIDVTKVRVTPPSGTTAAELTVVCRGGATVTRPLNASGVQTIDLTANPAVCPGSFPSSVSVKYTGDIANNATGKLDLVGTLNDGAVAGSLANCAATTLTNAGSPGPVTSEGCKTLTIEPSTARSTTAKKFCGGTNPDCPAGSPPVVVGLNSPVAMGVTGTNTSGFTVSTLTIREPEPGNTGAKAAFDAVDASTVRVTIPAGVTSTTVTATCRTGTSTPRTITGLAGTEQTVAALCSGGGLPDSIQVTFTGTIANNASGRLAILGTANSKATTAALANCAQTTAARPGSTDGVSRACATLTPVPNQTTGTGTKTFVPDNNLDYTQDGDAVAGLGSGVSMTITGENTSKFPVGSLTITEPDPTAAATFAKVDITKLRITPPTGTTKQTVTITCRSGANPAPTVFNNAATQNLTNPCGTSFPATVAVRFEGSIAVSATGTLRLAGTLNDAATAGTLTNCATVAIDSTGSPSTSTRPCANLTVKPNTLTAAGAKTFVPDNNLDFTPDGQAYEGQSSGVLLSVTGTNTSGFAVQRLIITEPDPTDLSAKATLAQIDVEKVRLTPPTGTTTTTVTATCRSGSSNTLTFSGTAAKTYTAAELCGATLPEAVQATFTGQIPNGQGGTLAMVGRLKDTAQGTLPNCATVGVENTGSPNSPIVKPCASLIVQKPNIDFDRESKTSGGIGVIVPGQPLEFTLSFRNNSDIPVTNVVLDDPVSTNPIDLANPFEYVRLVEASTPAAPVNQIEVYDPQAGAYVPYDGADAGLLARATGIRVRVTGTMAVGATFNALRYKVVLRDGVNTSQVPPITFQNCAAVGTPNPDPADRFCNETPISVVPGSTGGNTNKSFDPSNLDRPWPGQDPLTVPTTNVRLLIQNTGQLNLSTLVLTDVDADFWDAYDFVGNVRVNLPPGADRVQLDVCTSKALCTASPPTFVLGTATSVTNPVPLPAGVDPAEVRGIRVSFFRADGAYLLTPSTALPSGNNCNANNVCIQVRPRSTTLSTGELVPAEVVNTAEAKGRSIRQGNDPNLPDYFFPIGNPPATITLTEGQAAMDLDKDPDSRIGPGETAPFTLVIENTGAAGIPALYVRDPLPAELEFQPGTYPGAPAGQPYLIEYDLPTGTPPPPTVEFTPTTETLPGVPPAVRTSQLNWRFPGWVLVPGGKVTITYNVGLTPGTAANVDVRNTAGITSEQQGFTFECTPDNADDGVVQPGGTFGTPSPVTSRFCTSYANVRSLEGTAFSASKWSAGRDELGFRNTLTGTVTPTSSDLCPRLVVGGTTYTRYPCVAQNYPGQGFTFLLKLTNTSNNAITSSIRIMDTLPVAGDRGVLLVNQARGTQWSTPPRLLTAPTELSGFGIGQARFTTDSTIAPATPLCFELSPGVPGQPDNTVPDPCARATWGATFPDDRKAITAVDGTLQFDGQNALLPGQSALVTARVDSPTSLEGQALAPVAWNSYAHEEILFVTGSGEEVRLPPTEPIKAGIAVVFGNVQVTKSVPNPPAGIDLGTFPINYRCTTTTEQPDGSQGAPVEVASGSLAVGANATVGVPGPLPAGARCAFWETDANGGVGSNLGEDNAVSITVQPGATVEGEQPPQDVTITNDYPVGSLELTKTLAGPGVGLPLLPQGAWGDGPFAVNVSCSFRGQVISGFPRDVAIVPGKPTTIEGLPIGATCDVVETATGAAVSTSTVVDGVATPGPGATVPIPDGSTQVEFVNSFTTGTLRINKLLTGAGADYADRDFVFTVTCVRKPLVFEPVTATITPIPGDPTSLTTLVQGLPAGSICAVREVDDGGAAGENPPPGKLVATVVIKAGETAEATVVAENDFPAGRVSISKIVTGPGASAAAGTTFTIDVTCQRTDRDGAPVTIFTEPVQIQGGQTVPIDRPVPVGGSCWAVETVTGGATTVDIDYDSADNAIEVTEANVATGIGITATNYFGVGGLTIIKDIEGAGAGFADQPFVFDVTCTLAGQTVYDQDVTITPPTLTASLIGLPTGAECTVVEKAPFGGADGPAALSPPGPYTIGQGGAVEVTATNTFSVGSVRVAKTVVNQGVDLTLIPDGVILNFPILVTCQRPIVDGTYADLPGFPRTEVLSVTKAQLPTTVSPFTVDKAIDVDLPIGTRCWGEELDSQGATKASVDFDSPDNAVTVTLPQQGSDVPPITATNIYEPGGLVLRKVVEGAGAGFAKQPFEFLVQCTVGGTPLNPITLTIKPPKTTAGVGGILQGASCTITETVTGGADGPAVIESSPVTIPGGVALPVAVTATNTFSAGSLTVDKVLDGPGASFASDVEFTLRATCTWTVDGQNRTVLDEEFTLTGGQEKEFAPLPLGAQCAVTETKSGGATATDITGPVTITAGKPDVTITATNTFTVGAVRITKVIEPADYPYADRPFTFAAACTFAGAALPVRTVTIFPPATVGAINNLPTGAVCDLTETDAGGADAPATISPSQVKIGDGAQGELVQVTATNTFSLGSLTLTKRVTGPGAEFVPDDTQFGLRVKCSREGPNGLLPFLDELVTVTSEVSVPLGVDLPIGAQCSIVEEQTMGATGIEVSPSEVTITRDTPDVEVTATNTYDLGRMTLRKVIDPEGFEFADRPFTFLVQCTFLGQDGLIPDRQVTIKPDTGKQVATIDGIPVGAQCSARELPPYGGADGPAVMSPQSVTIPRNDDPQVAEIIATNTFSVGSLRVSKVVDGPAAAEVAATRVFDLKLTCTREGPNGPVRFLTETASLRGGESASYGGLPIGAVCQVTEPTTQGATSTVITPKTVEVTLEEPNVDVVVTNTYNVGGLRIRKAITGPGAKFATQAFTFDVACTFQGAALATRTATIAPPATTATVTGVPTGASCSVVETGTGGADAPAVVSPTTVTVEDTATVEVTATNTFSVARIDVAKVVVGEGAGPYTFLVSCTWTVSGRAVPVALPSGGVLTLDDGDQAGFDVPAPSTCTVTETDVSADAEVTIRETGAVGTGSTTDGIVALGAIGDRALVEVTNTFPPLGPTTDGENDKTNDQPGRIASTGASLGYLPVGLLALLLGGLLVRGSRRRDG